MPSRKQYQKRQGRDTKAHAKLKKDVSLEDTIFKLASAVEGNARIIGQFVALFEILKDKDIVTDEDLGNKFKQLDEERQQQAKEQLEAERKILVQQQEKEHDKRNEGKEGIGQVETGKQDSDSVNPEGGDIQPEGSGNDEGSEPDGGCELLREDSDRSNITSIRSEDVGSETEIPDRNGEGDSTPSLSLV